jgi:hypothetical protein
MFIIPITSTRLTNLLIHYKFHSDIGMVMTLIMYVTT